MNTTSPVDDTTSVRPALGLALIALLGFGLLYSLAGAGLGRWLFPQQAAGSLVERDGTLVGSALVAQPFAGDGYFHPRPSAANYDAMAAAGSNQARSNPDLRKRIEQARAAIAAREGIAATDVPIELITQSGGGLDPHITPRGAQVQAARVARARGIDVAQVEQLIARHTDGPQFGLFGQPRVNVLELNLMLDSLQ